MTNRTTQYIYFLLIGITCLITYWGVLSQPWTYDDLDHIQSAQLAQSNWTHLFSTQAKEPTRWVLNTYFYLTYQVFGENPQGYHAVGILFHAINAGLCAYLIFKLFNNTLLAGLSGFLFAIHCAPYEAIYKISATGLLIGTTTAMLSVLFTKSYLHTLNKYHLLGIVVCYTITIFSYESLLSIFIPILYLWWTDKHKKIHLPIALFAPLSLFILLDLTIYDTTNHKLAFNAITPGWHILSNFGFFIARLFLNAYFTPFGWDGPPPFDIDSQYISHYAIIGGCITVLLCILSLRNRTLQFATIWIIATTLPYILGTNQFFFSRYWYLPSIGSVVIFSAFLSALYHKPTLTSNYKSFLLTAALLLLTLSSYNKSHFYEGRFLTDAANYHLIHKQNTPYAITLYERAEKNYNIQHPILFHQQAIAYGRMGDYEKAQTAILKSIQVRPNYLKSHLALSAISYEKKDFQTAIDAILYAMQQDKHLIKDLHTLADRLKRDKHHEQALLAYQKMIEYDPDYPDIQKCYLNISDILYVTNQTQASLGILQNLLQIYPEYTEAKNLLQKIQTQKEYP